MQRDKRIVIKCLTKKDASKLYNFILSNKDLFSVGEICMNGRKVEWRLLE